MKTLKIPKFDSSGRFINKYVTIKVKNKMDSKDYQKVVKELPGLPLGYVPELYTISEPIEVTQFYDIRQKRYSRLKGYFITVIK